MAAPGSRPSKPNHERVEESTLALITAAIQLFGEKGYHQTTAAEIGSRAGFSRNMVRDRYGTKEELLRSLFEAEFGRRLLPAARRERRGRGLDRVLGVLDDLTTSVEAEPELIRAMIALTFETPVALRGFAPWFEELIEVYQSELRDHLRAGQYDGSVREDMDADREAEQFVSYAIGLCFRSVLYREKYDFAGALRAWRDRAIKDYSASTGTSPATGGG
ncbi:TetR/AcrR family transcriptional regulator [Actinomycetospora sp. TBRC 11914]|uniref:TetR/AcrR family transcriptional regulator n=1 Tax=Actinomycetospora sp. TBRC 11914 TaxID=2729387 RepID=UPI00145F08C4|nr:TetR/AcrR family transcriptional regulator [Actinomycetospora sp. TBRC 11914]NMO91693.1 TetR/AcrR family transcriptional regulator [Actinomycetospora sp. TBRC 11914]